MTDSVTSPRMGAQVTGQERVVNDFQIIVATKNGTGSQTSNSVILRALFTMGIPVTGKNIFPSNIQGLPTWYTIRLSKDGYIARREISEVLVAMNEDTIWEDVKQLPPGGVCLYPEEWASRFFSESREDIFYYPLPVDAIIKGSEVSSELADRVRNMVYVGGLAALLGIDLAHIERALDLELRGKRRAIQINLDVVNTAYNYVMDRLPKADPYFVEPMERTKGMIMLDGNSAAALGAVFGGVGMIAWYPITPSTSLVDAAREYLAEMRHDPETGKATYAIVQAEDELAAIGMVVGAGWAGLRAMTATSGPGLSLMTEFAGLAYFAEVPSVIWDVQRVGPSTGLPTRTSQGDVLMAYFLGHGDTKHPVLLPATIKECFEFGWKAFDLAERLQTLVLVLSDLDLGMNQWMDEPFEYPDRPLDRGKVLTAEDLERIETFGRYIDVDGDGIPYRTLPGNPNPKGAYFARGTGHNARAVYSERPEDWQENMTRLSRKFETARTMIPKPVVDGTGHPLGLIAYGTTHHTVVEARDRLKAKGLEFDYLRIRALPLEATTREFIAAHDRVYVVENNHDGQMAKLLSMEYPELAGRLVSIAYLDGMPLSARWLVAEIEGKEL
ncbi:MAG: 2-oxoacid:acceptor oxidoreductase subunit alpha [Anaerolineae bacterium]